MANTAMSSSVRVKSNTSADVLRMPQPTLSRSIRRLEDDFGFALFDRVGRKVKLNDAGRTAVEWARQLLRDEQLMREAVETSAKQTQMLRVGTVWLLRHYGD